VCSRRTLLRAVGLGFAALGLGGAPPAAALSREYEIKAAFLFNFIKFVEWPPEALPPSSSTITVGVLGRNPFGNALNVLNGKTVKGKTVAVRQVPSVAAASDVHLLFISASEGDRMRQILGGLRNANVLTVADVSGFIERGGVINLITRNERVRFEINAAAAERAGLALSSQLLRLAAKVERA
jgi:hypothetical protein